MGLVAKLTKLDQKKYFETRRKAMGLQGNYPEIMRKIFLIRVLRINRKYASNIYTSVRGGGYSLKLIPFFHMIYAESL